MPVVKWEKQESVAVLSMDNGPNVQNLDFALGMLQALAEILEDPGIGAVVLHSTDEKNWSQGVDLGWLMERFGAGDTDSIKQFMYRMNDVFKTLLTAPLPFIAAINGHAYGNGAILACACDFRFMRKDKGFFCFPEVDKGIPFLPSMLGTVRKAIPMHKLNEMQLTGKRVAAPELEEQHVIDKACAAGELLQDAVGFGATFQKKRGIFGELKRRLHKDIALAMEKEDPLFIEPFNLMVMD